MKQGSNSLLRLIAIFKLVKAMSLIAVGFGALHLFHDNDAAESITRVVEKIGLNPGGRYLDHALAGIARLPAKDFRDLGIGSFIYAALFMTEGVGLWLLKRWAEWFTVIITASLLPLEIYDIHHHPTIAKVVVLLINVLVVAYLILRIRKDSSADRQV
jgi:uncharacterized membrane protein (DUF2068 family)